MPDQDESEELEPLRLEHFYLSFAILGVGLGMATIILANEFCFYKFCCKNQKSQ